MKVDVSDRVMLSPQVAATSVSGRGGPLPPNACLNINIQLFQHFLEGLELRQSYGHVYETMSPLHPLQSRSCDDIWGKISRFEGVSPYALLI